MSDNARECLQCGETRASIKAQGIIACCTLSHGEYTEVNDEWPQHRWKDWTDEELAQLGVVPEAFERHRRTDASTFQWIACVDTKRGHCPADESCVPDLASFIGQCIACGHDTRTDTKEASDGD
jgi:hypothetical protein